MPQINRPDTSTWSYLSRKLEAFKERRSLMDIVSGGEYKTSKDLPSFKELYDVAAERQAAHMAEEILPGSGVTQGTLYDIVTGTAGIAKFGGGAVKAGVKAVKKIRSIQKLKNQKEIIKNISKHPMTESSTAELKQISKEIETYLGPQRSAKIMKQGGRAEAKTVRTADRVKWEQVNEKLENLTKREGGIVRVEYEKSLDLTTPQAVARLTKQQQIEREKLREDERLFRELGGSQRGRRKKGIL